MRLFKLALLILLVALSVAAGPLPITVQDAYKPSRTGSSNGDVLGVLANFDLDYVRFTVITAQQVEALIHVNYNHDGLTSPLALDAWNWGSMHFNSGDLLFDVGATYKYAVPIAPHDSLTAGALYSITNVKDSDTVLGTSSGIRPDIPVWMNSSGASLIGSKTALTWAREVGSGLLDAAGTITIRFVPTAGFLADLSNPGLSVHFAAATCANDYVHGSIQYAVPEPVSMVLMGGGLVALSLFGRWRLSRRRK